MCPVNAKIISMEICVRGKSLTAFLMLEYSDGARQGLGGCTLYHPSYVTSHMGCFIYRTLEIAGVENLGDLPGREVRVRYDYTYRIIAIGDLAGNNWFNPSVELGEVGD